MRIVEKLQVSDTRGLTYSETFLQVRSRSWLLFDRTIAYNLVCRGRMRTYCPFRRTSGRGDTGTSSHCEFVVIISTSQG